MRYFYIFIYGFILNHCQEGNVHKDARTQELKKKAFTVKGQSIKQAIAILGTFILEMKLEKNIFC